jgi:pterin-4a-carbinolamine dehydratase
VADFRAFSDGWDVLERVAGTEPPAHHPDPFILGQSVPGVFASGQFDTGTSWGVSGGLTQVLRVSLN